MPLGLLMPDLGYWGDVLVTFGALALLVGFWVGFAIALWRYVNAD